MKKSRLNEMTVDQKAKRAADRVVRYFNLRWDPKIDDPFEEGTDCYTDVQNYIQGCVNGAQIESVDSIYIQEVIEEALEDFIANYASPLDYEPIQENKNTRKSKLKEDYDFQVSAAAANMNGAEKIEDISDRIISYYARNWEGEDPFDDSDDNECFWDISEEISNLFHKYRVSNPELVEQEVTLALENYINGNLKSRQFESKNEAKKAVKESVYYEEDISTVPASVLQNILDYVLGYYMEKWDGVNPVEDYNCRNDLEAEMEDCTIEKGYDPEEEFVARDLQSWVIEPIYAYYKETYGY